MAIASGSTDNQVSQTWLIGRSAAVFLAAILTGCFHTTPTTTATIPNCSGAGCCCNSPIEHNNPTAGSWPDCAAGFTCKGLQPGGVVHPGGFRVDVNVCQANGAPLSAPLMIKPGEPSFCRTDI